MSMGIYYRNQIKKRTMVIVVIVGVCVLLSAYVVLQFIQKEEQLPVFNDTGPAGEVYFCETTLDPGVFAVGMIINNNHSIVFLWNKTSNTTAIEIDYICPPQFKEAFNLILEQGLSPYTDRKIVPCDLNKTSEDVYDFKYYDGWEYHWSFGYAKLYLSNKTIQYISHVR